MQDQEVPESDWPPTLRREVARIRICPAVSNGSVFVIGDAAGNISIRFKIKTERLLEAKATSLLEEEPMVFAYGALETVGEVAPTAWSDRPDFPRDIGHINPTLSSEPVSLCLALAGLQNIYDGFGVDGVLARLIEWLHDAKTGQLMKHGWEPVPMGIGQESKNAYYDIGVFQNIAEKSGPDIQWACGVARYVNSKPEDLVVLLTPPIKHEDEIERTKAKRQILEKPDDQKIKYYFPWVFVWSDYGSATDKPIFDVWNSLGEIERGLKETGLDRSLPNAIVQTVLGLSDTNEATGRRPIALVLGIRRPQPISSAVFGMSNCEQARKLELKSYLLHCEQSPQDPLNSDIAVEELVGLQLPTREMLSFTSGVDVSGGAALMGYGALGSGLADFLMRAGIPKIVAIDKDTFAPHNIARHTALVSDLCQYKVSHLQQLAKKVNFFEKEIQTDCCAQDIANISEEEMGEYLAGCSIAIDATADERVRRHLAKAALPKGTRLVRTEIYDNGNLGTIFVPGIDNNPNLIDLYYLLCSQALECEPVERWLKNETKIAVDSEELLVGMGCASATTKLPKFSIYQHATAFMPTIISALNGGATCGVGINPVDEQGHPIGWQWIPAGTVTVLKSQTALDWEIRLSEYVVTQLAALRERHGEIETGGYLYGGYDFVLRQVYVIAVSEMPPSTKQSASSIELGEAGLTALERQLRRKAGGKIDLIGTWHSHPRSGHSMSQKDRSTMERFRKIDSENGMPTLLVITSPKGLGAHLWI